MLAFTNYNKLFSQYIFELFYFYTFISNGNFVSSQCNFNIGKLRLLYYTRLLKLALDAYLDYI